MIERPEMIENIFHRDLGGFLRCGSGSLDQLHGLRRGQLRRFVVDETGNSIARRQQLDATTKEHFEVAGLSCKCYQCCPPCMQLESERGDCSHGWKSKAGWEWAQVGQT